ncbi:MAG TPA: hypothetical protein VNY36_07505 [Bacteroidia bacterium]|jgi:hypothetical protein|nr:hypothetical protein [Bacteroidia bacterium]
MKKTLALSICLFFIADAFAQQKKTTKPVYHQAKPTMSPERQKMLCRPWKLDTVENFGVAKPANATEQNDGITLMADSTLFLTMEGKVATGKWFVGWSPKIINTVTGTTTPPTKMMFTIMSLSDSYMELEYQTPDLIRTHYFYSAKK